MNIENIYNLFEKFPNICTDNRLAAKNSIFFALTGNKFNGNKFASQALEKCEYAVVDDPKVAVNDKYILVDNVLTTLQKLATYHRKSLKTRVIAITGTNGKTTTKELIYAVLSTEFNVLKTEGNLNNHIGVPLTLLKLKKEHQFCVLEMGANHIGEIKELCNIALPDYGIITNVGKAHLEGFGSFEGVRKAKAELYNYLYNSNGIAFVNSDNQYLEDMNPPRSVIYYGKGKFNHVQGVILTDTMFLSYYWIPSRELSNSDIECVKSSLSYRVNTKLIGNYNFDNALAATCIGNYFDVAIKNIKQAIEEYEPTNNRSQLLKTQFNTLLLDNYNANPSSMDVAITNFAEINLPNKVLILGDMLELGEASIREHGVLLDKLKQLNFTDVLLVGKNFKTLSSYSQFTFFDTIDELNKHLSSCKFKGKSILLKGSRGMALELAIENL